VVQELFAQNPAIASASLGLIEVTATLARKRKAREIDPLSFEQKVQELEDDEGSFIQIHLSTETADVAKDLARNMALHGADAVHLASALVLQRRFADAEDRLAFAIRVHHPVPHHGDNLLAARGRGGTGPGDMTSLGLTSMR
jgi:hypothetical protein